MIQALSSLLLLSTLAGVATAEEVDSRLRAHVEHLASDRMAGRGIDTAEITLAEEYIAEQLAGTGLIPLPGQDDYFVDFHYYAGGFDAERTRLDLFDEAARPRLGSDFRPLRISALEEVEGEIVFAGYGISAPEHDYDDYAELDVRDKIVMIFRFQPEVGELGETFRGSNGHALFTSKSSAATRHGAKGVLLVTGPLHREGPEDLRLPPIYSLHGDADVFDRSAEAELPFLQISASVAEHLVGVSGHDLETIQRALDGREPLELSGLGRARIAVAAREDHHRRLGRDVAAFLPGSDPELRDEWILVGAHHDHIGAFEGDGDTVFNGADDNASGTAAVLELARRFGREESRPKRSLVFMTFTGEERGLLGSRVLLEREILDVDQLRLMINLDMVGRNPEDPLQIIGTDVSRGLAELVQRANAELDLDLVFPRDAIRANSDHFPFHESGVPILQAFTGLHRQYHDSGDHAELLDYERMASIVDLIFATCSLLASGDSADMPHRVHHLGWFGGEIVFLEQADPPRLRLESLDEGSPADRAGLAQGDDFRVVDGTAVRSPRRGWRLLQELAPQEILEIERLGSDGPERLELSRPHPGFLGIVRNRLARRERRQLGLEAPLGVRVEDLLDDGPARDSGLRRGDVIVAVDGFDVGFESLVDRLEQIGAGSTVELSVLRQGEIQKLKVELARRP